MVDGARPDEGGDGNLGALIRKQMEDFDAFTFTVAQGDPVRRKELERGTIRDYWRSAEDYVRKVAEAKERADNAARKVGVTSPATWQPKRK